MEKIKVKKRSYIPSIITLMNLSCGFMAIMVADYYKSSIFLLFSLLFDVLDGFAARKLNAASELGKELDSLADLTSFGVAPAYLYYLLSPIDGWLSMLPPVVMVVASAYRLAKFNLLPPSPYFSGLPTPATAMFFIGLFLAVKYDSAIITNLLQYTWFYIVVPVFFAFMMVSNLQMFSLKGIKKKDMKQNLLQITLLVIFILLLLFDNKLAAPLIVIVYILLSAAQAIVIKA
jgi:CDP-diacylglycerol---serine O-phosphatidyltransferase